MNLILYGPPGSGKTTVGQLVAARLGREFIDADAYLETHWQRPIPDYFEKGEEALFRTREAEVCRRLAARADLVIAPGGGALLRPANRAALESTGVIICLTAALDTLLARLAGSHPRPLLAGDPRTKLTALLADRAALYQSFAVQVNTDGLAPDALAEAVLARFNAHAGLTRFELGAGSALLGHGLLARLPELLAEKNLQPPFVLIADSNVAALHGQRVSQIIPAPLVQFPAGEDHKNLDTVRQLYTACLAHRLDRHGTLLALGGGVTGDLAGFVAATYMRGVKWANLPTTVLAMADAGLGGKVGCDLPEGKNLVGAFHPPALVLTDFEVLATLPAGETRNGLAEVIKSAVVGDADLFTRLAAGDIELGPAIARAAAVKVGLVNADLYERGERALLNLGHTFGHAIETVSHYQWAHGAAVAVGLVAAAWLAQALGLAEPGLDETLADCLNRYQLPTRCPGLAPKALQAAMLSDKKKTAGQIKFVLPRRIGAAQWDVAADERLVLETLKRITA